MVFLYHILFLNIIDLLHLHISHSIVTAFVFLVIYQRTCFLNCCEFNHLLGWGDWQGADF